MSSSQKKTVSASGQPQTPVKLSKAEETVDPTSTRRKRGRPPKSKVQEVNQVNHSTGTPAGTPTGTAAGTPTVNEQSAVHADPPHSSERRQRCSQRTPPKPGQNQPVPDQANKASNVSAACQPQQCIQPSKGDTQTCVHHTTHQTAPATHTQGPQGDHPPEGRQAGPQRVAPPRKRGRPPKAKPQEDSLPLRSHQVEAAKSGAGNAATAGNADKVSAGSAGNAVKATAATAGNSVEASAGSAGSEAKASAGSAGTGNTGSGGTGSAATNPIQSNAGSVGAPESSSAPVKRGRGRPPKPRPVVQPTPANPTDPTAQLEGTAPVKRGRGRPRKLTPAVLATPANPANPTNPMDPKDQVRSTGGGKPSDGANQQHTQLTQGSQKRQEAVTKREAVMKQEADTKQEAVKKRRKRGKRAKGADAPKQEPAACAASCEAVYQRCLARAKVQIGKLNMLQHSMAVHAADGWKQSSREKVKLTVQMEELQAQLERCQQVIVECVVFCEEAEGDRAIAKGALGEYGEVAEKDIFCARCHDFQSHDDNDIILCDGSCNRAYHEQCLQPRVHAKELSEDEPWLCYACTCKLEILDLINEVLGTSSTLDTHSSALFTQTAPAAEGAAAPQPSALPRNGFLLTDFPSSDEEDEDFRADVSVSSASANSSGGDEGSDSDSDSGSDSSEMDSRHKSLASTSGELPEEELLHGAQSPRRRQRRRAVSGSTRSPGVDDAQPSEPPSTSREGMSRAEETDGELQPSAAKRRRTQVDYKALHDQLFGPLGGEQEGSEDEDVEYDPSM